MDILSMAPVDDYVTTNISLTKQRTLELEVASIDPVHIVNVLSNLEIEMRGFEGLEGVPMRTWSQQHRPGHVHGN